MDCLGEVGAGGPLGDGVALVVNGPHLHGVGARFGEDPVGVGMEGTLAGAGDGVDAGGVSESALGDTLARKWPTRHFRQF